MAESKARPERFAREGGDVDIDRDRALVLRCQEGDGAAFAELYTQYHDRLHRFCMRRLLDRDEAEEVTQEAFLRAWRALPGFAGGLRFYPWLTVIAKNLCTDAQRRRARYGEVSDLDRHASLEATRFDPFSTAMSSEETVMASFDGQLAAEALTRLSDRHRHVLSLREESGLTYQEIASAEGVEVSTVETLLWRARQALKREYAALSGTRVLGGVLVAGGAMRRLLERLSRRAARLAAAAGRIRVRDLAAAGVVTVALVSVTGAPSLSAKAEPTPPAATSTPAANSSSTAGPSTSTGPTSAPPTVPAATPTPSTGGPALPTAGSSVAAGSSGGGGSAPALPLPTGTSQVGSQVTSQVTSQVSSIVNDVTGTLGQVTSGASGLTGTVGGAIPQLPVPPTVQKTVSGVGGLLGH